MRETDMYKHILDGNPSISQCEKIIGYAENDIKLREIEIKTLKLMIDQAKTIIVTTSPFPKIKSLEEIKVHVAKMNAEEITKIIKEQLGWEVGTSERHLEELRDSLVDLYCSGQIALPLKQVEGTDDNPEWNW